jgi:hypothetical protein
MNKVDVELQRVLELVVEELDARPTPPVKEAEGSEEEYDRQDGQAARSRSQPSSFRTPAFIHYFPHASERTVELPARTRRLSTGGILLVSRRVFSVGTPVAIEVALSREQQCCLAGIVTACRYASRGYHEIDVALQAAQTSMARSEDLKHAEANLSWLAQSRHPMESGQQGWTTRSTGSVD